MIKITQDDELKDLSPSASIYEATDAAATEDAEDDGVDSEYQFGQSNDVIQADAQALLCHAECLKAGPLFKSLHKVIDEYKGFILAMKRKFQYKRGFRGLRIKFPDFQEPVFFPEYCLKVFDVTAHRLNQLLEHADEPFVKSTPKPLEERADYIKGLQAGRQAAETQYIAKGADIKAALADIVQEATPPPPPTAIAVIDTDDVYAYFSQLEKEPETLAFEIVAMLETLGLDGQQIQAVSDLMKKQAKKPAAKSAKA